MCDPCGGHDYDSQHAVAADVECCMNRPTMARLQVRVSVLICRKGGAFSGTVWGKFGGDHRVLGAVAVAAAWIPARRAMRVDPAMVRPME